MADLVLVIEDEKEIRDLIRYNLERAGFRVATVGDGEEGLKRLFAARPDVVVLDLMLPGRSGLEVLREVRAEASTRDLPVLVLTARAAEMDTLLGFEHGADDYLTKPFSPRELIARLQALLRRSKPATDGGVLDVGDLTVNTLSREITFRGKPLVLTPREFDLLGFLARHPGRVLSREELLRKVWGYDYLGETRTVDVHIRRLRVKLGETHHVIETVTGAGYKLVMPARQLSRCERAAPMNLSLRARLFLAYLLVLGVTLAAVALLAAREQRAWVVERAGAELERLSLVAREALHDEVRAMPGDWPAIADSLGVRTACRVTLIAADGRVLGDSGIPSTRLASVENHAGRPEVHAALAGHVGRDLRRSGTLGTELMYVARPADAGEVRVLRLAEPLSVIAALRGSLLRLSVIAALLALVLGALLVLAVTAHHVNRIRDLEHVTGQLTADEQPHRARETPADELGRLGAALNRMSAERRARMALLERERDEREQILAHMSDGVALIDGQGRIVRCNQSLATLLAAPLPAAPGTPFREFVRAPELDELLQDARRQGRPAELDLRLWTPTPRLVNASAIPLGPESEDALLLVLRDLSEIERSNRVRQDFVANVSHELRTPLTSLRGYAETLLEGGLEDVEHRATFVRVIRDNAVRLEALAEDLLSLADLERPGARLRRESFDLRAMAERQVAIFRSRAEAQGLALTLEPGPPLEVAADRPRLEQVMANLLDNALKYTERGSVTVRLGGDSAWAWCEVSDTGQGIPEDDVPRVFERFYRVDKARSRDKGGTGLGLSIVKHIMALHDGEVAVTSVVGEGSTFRIHFPRGPIEGVRTA